MCFKGAAYNVVVLERKVFLGNLLEAQNQSSGFGVGPGALVDEARTSSLILGVFKDALELGVCR